MRTVQIAAIVGAVLVAAPALAQEVPAPPPPPRAPAPPPAPPSPTPPRLQVLRRPYFRDDSAYLNRPTLGMTLSMTGSKRDTLGVFVTRVEANGPAERAGIIEGDRIAAIDDVNLRANVSDLDDPYTLGLPAHRLSRAVGKLTVGSTVRLRVYSNGRYRDVNVTAGRMGDVYRERSRAMMFSGMDIGGMIAPAMEQIGPIIREEMVPRLEQLGPTIERAMREIPRNIQIELRDQF